MSCPNCGESRYYNPIREYCMACSKPVDNKRRIKALEAENKRLKAIEAACMVIEAERDEARSAARAILGGFRGGERSLLDVYPWMETEDDEIRAT